MPAPLVPSWTYLDGALRAWRCPPWRPAVPHPAPAAPPCRFQGGDTNKQGIGRPGEQVMQRGTQNTAARSGRRRQRRAGDSRLCGAPLAIVVLESSRGSGLQGLERRQQVARHTAAQTGLYRGTGHRQTVHHSIWNRSTCNAGRADAGQPEIKNPSCRPAPFCSRPASPPVSDHH